MKNITITVPDEKYEEYLARIKGLDMPDAAVNEDFEVPEWQQKIVLERVKNAKEEDFISLEDLQKELDGIE